MRLPLRLHATHRGYHIEGAAADELAPWKEYDDLRKIERASIRLFMEQYKDLLVGRVLDFGCGQQPYRDLVTGQYVGVDKDDPIPVGPYDAVICNQVFQYMIVPETAIGVFAHVLKPGGRLVMTYATNWPVCETTDLWRHTPEGMRLILSFGDFRIVESEMRAAVVVAGQEMPLGYGLVAEFL